MFTGIVEGLGTVAKLISEGDGVRLSVQVPSAMTDVPHPEACRIGDSVAINGCCLTVIEINAAQWTFQAGAETLSKTNLGQFREGDAVNLERAMPVHGRLGGHVVQGHVDGTGHVAKIEQHADWSDLWFEIPPTLTRLMVPKGSVAIDGVSLTLVNVEHDRVSVALIPHTLAMTTLGRRKVGDTVNIETDILGKYVEKLLQR